MNTPLGTPVRQAKLGLISRSLPMTNDYKKLFNEQYQRLWTKHQQDLDLIDDIRSYVKARLSIEREYSSSLAKLAKQHSSHIAKKFTLLDLSQPNSNRSDHTSALNESNEPASFHDLDVSDSRLQKRLANSGPEEPETACSLYKVWSEHINRLQVTTKNRAEQFEQLIMVVDKLKDIRSHKSSIAKKCLDNHLKRIHEDLLVSMIEVDKAKKLYYEDESQAKKARENEEKIRKKKSGLMTKFTDLQAKKEKTLAQREANDIQSTQARNEYIMALASANAQLQHYFNRDLGDFINLVEDGCLDHCKIFMVTLSECDINSLKDSLASAQYWSKMINLTGSQKTNSIFLECEQSGCLRAKLEIPFEPCNNDPIQAISLDHNADYALQHEIDKWSSWFKKEVRNLGHHMIQLETCRHALAEGKKSIVLDGQNEDLESKIIELKQQIRKSEASKLKAQARLRVIKEGGMPVQAWSDVEDEIRADMARAQEELAAKRSKGLLQNAQDDDVEKRELTYATSNPSEQIHLRVSRGSEDSDVIDSSLHNLAPVSRSASGYEQRQVNANPGYSDFTDPSLVWQDDPQSASGFSQTNYNVVVTGSQSEANKRDEFGFSNDDQNQDFNRNDLLSASNQQTSHPSGQQNVKTSMTVQSSSPLSAIMDGGGQGSPSMYPGMMSEAYKSDYECDYNRSGHALASSVSSVDPIHQNAGDSFVPNHSTLAAEQEHNDSSREAATGDVFQLVGQRVVALYQFEKSNDDDLEFNQNDVLRVIEISDPDWARALNEATNEQGYIPTSYVRLLTDYTADEASRKDENTLDEAEPTEPSLNLEDTQQASNSLDVTEANRICRASYDFEPESETFADDGLPHLSLKQGEMLRVLDTGELDGWWLVERESSGERGHVPSMLVEEIDPYANEADQYDDNDEDLSEGSDVDELENSIKAMPSFEPPVLKPPCFDESSGLETVDVNNNSEKQELVEPNDSDTIANHGSCKVEISSLDVSENIETQREPNLEVEQCEDKTEPVQEKENLEPEPEPEAKQEFSRLIPTSFIIVEPTPEVESKSFEEIIAYERSDKSERSEKPADDRPVVFSDKSKPPVDVSYSVVNSDFVLEAPSRRPNPRAEEEEEEKRKSGQTQPTQEDRKCDDIC